MSEEKDDINQSEEIQNLIEVKKVLESEVLLQKEILKTSFQLGFTFLIDSVISDDDLEDQNPEICDEDIMTLEYNQRCLNTEVEALKDILNERNKDLEELTTEINKQRETANDDIDQASNNQQLFEDIVRGNKYLQKNKIIKNDLRITSAISFEEK